MDNNFKIKDGVLVGYLGKEEDCCQVVIPESVKEIGFNAFEAEEYNSDNIPSDGESLINSDIKKIFIPKSVTKIDKSAFIFCSELLEIEVSSDNENYSSYDNCLYNKDKSSLLYVPSAKKEINIYENTVVIEDKAFGYCKHLKDVLIPQSVKEIKDSAFEMCFKIESITFSKEGLESIGEYVFSDCTSLKTLSIPGTVKKMGKNLFPGCDNLSMLEFVEGTKRIEDGTLFKGNFETLVIPSSVEYIGENVCSECFYLKNISLSENNKNYYLKDGAVYDKKTDRCVLCPEGLKEEGILEENYLTDSVVYLDDKKSSVLFGDWPQSLKKNDVLIDEKKVYTINGWKCYKGTDGCYYTKKTVMPYYNLDDIVIGNDYPIYFLDKKTRMEDEAYYYFKIESIQWDILTDDYQGGKLLLAKNILSTESFYYGFKMRENGKVKIKDNDYEYSHVRSYLNGLNGYVDKEFAGKGFIDMAFSKTAQEKLKKVTVTNNTQDKVFLLSEKEVTNSSYGLPSSDEKGSGTFRSKKLTDFSKSCNIEFSDNEEYSNTAMWWLRSPSAEKEFDVQYVDYSGSCDKAMSCTDILGVVPAIVI